MKVKKLSSNDYVVLLKKGDDLLSCLKEFHSSVNMSFCSVSAIGALCDVSLGYAFLENGVINYNNVVYTDEYELLSLSGNMSVKDNESMIHLHAVLSDKDNKCVGGHLNYATVSIVCEMFITVYDSSVSRSFDESVGINVLDV